MSISIYNCRRGKVPTLQPMYRRRPSLRKKSEEGGDVGTQASSKLDKSFFKSRILRLINFCWQIVPDRTYYMFKRILKPVMLKFVLLLHLEARASQIILVAFPYIVIISCRHQGASFLRHLNNKTNDRKILLSF